MKRTFGLMQGAFKSYGSRCGDSSCGLRRAGARGSRPQLRRGNLPARVDLPSGGARSCSGLVSRHRVFFCSSVLLIVFTLRTTCQWSMTESKAVLRRPQLAQWLMSLKHVHGRMLQSAPKSLRWARCAMLGLHTGAGKGAGGGAAAAGDGATSR
jgi:hypothetical protein